MNSKSQVISGSNLKNSPRKPSGDHYQESQRQLGSIKDLSDKDAKHKVLEFLHSKTMKMPPDTLFIRQNTKMLEKYLDREEMLKLREKIPEEYLLNFDEIFMLQDQDKIDRIEAKKFNSKTPM